MKLRDFLKSNNASQGDYFTFANGDNWKIATVQKPHLASQSSVQQHYEQRDIKLGVVFQISKNGQLKKKGFDE